MALVKVYTEKNTMTGGTYTEMVDILIITHGTLADGLINGAQTIMGPVDNLSRIQLKMDDSIEKFCELVIQKIESLGDKILIFTDLLGASPYNASAQAIREHPNKSVVCITGINLPMLLEAILKREDMDLEALVDYLMDVGKNGITKLSLNMYK